MTCVDLSEGRWKGRRSYWALLSLVLFWTRIPGTFQLVLTLILCLDPHTGTFWPKHNMRVWERIWERLHCQIKNKKYYWIYIEGEGKEKGSMYSEKRQMEVGVKASARKAFQDMTFNKQVLKSICLNVTTIIYICQFRF